MLELTINSYTNYEHTVEYYEGLVYYIVVTDDDVITFTDQDDAERYLGVNDLVCKFIGHDWCMHWVIDSDTHNAVEVCIEEHIYYC